MTVNPTKKARVYVLYTGGTIGMVPKEPGNPASPLVPGDKSQLQRYAHGLEEKGIDWIIEGLVDLDGKEVPPIDSSDIDADHWKFMAAQIERVYNDYHGFVILHGTDTMAYTASALSFLLENLAKPVVVTGSQLPISSVRTDGVKLLVGTNEPSQAVAEQCRRALLTPLGLPELSRCVVPGDSVAIVIDPETPHLIDLLVAVGEQLLSVPDSGIALSLMLPPDPGSAGWSHLVEKLPLRLQQELTVHVHDPSATDQLSYLASSAAGDRVYLNRRISDADLLVTIGIVCFDSLLGYRGTTSAIFPSFSDTDAIQQARTQGHPELTPEQPRPYRQLIDEVGWLLGTQFSVQVVPGPGDTPLAILAGLPEDVMTVGKDLVDRGTVHVTVIDLLIRLTLSLIHI